MSSSPWKITDWNEIIQRINTLAQNPDEGCDPIAPLDEVADPHKWSKGDISAAQSKLLAICNENTFAATPDLWKQKIVDELNSAIGRGWCGCQGPCPQDATIEVLFSQNQAYNIHIYGYSGGADPCAAFNSRLPSYYNYYAAAAGITGFGIGNAGAYNIYSRSYRDEVVIGGAYCYGNTFNRATGLQNPMPPPQYDGSGHLLNSGYQTELGYCTWCNYLKWSCFLWFCNCTPYGIGPLCCQGYPGDYDHPCTDCTMDLPYVTANQVPPYVTEEAKHTHRVEFFVEKWCY